MLTSSFDLPEPYHGNATSSVNGTGTGTKMVFFSEFQPDHVLSLFAVSSDAPDDSPGSSSHPLGLPFGNVEQRQSEGSSVATSNNNYCGFLPSNMTRRTHNMRSSPPHIPEDDAARNSGYPVGVSSFLPFGSLPSPSDRNSHTQHPLYAEPYFHSYRPPDISTRDVSSHDASIPTTAQCLESSRFADFAPDGSSNLLQSFNVLDPHDNPPHQISQSFIPGGYTSTGPFRSVNYPHYSPPQGRFPPPLTIIPYLSPPYYQPQYSEADGQASWSSPHYTIQQSDVTAGFQSNFPAPQISSCPTSALPPPKTPLNSPIPPRLPSPEQRFDKGSGRHGKEPLVRRSYHPNPPAYRLQWVMWVGNVPADATHDELWRFFTKPPQGTSDRVGVLSIFLISRTSCAFVNYEAEIDLNAAIKNFNGLPLRPGDPRCPKLVCRIRRKDDDLKAGVGGQRGIGMHIRWVKEQTVQGAKGQGTSSIQASLNILPKISNFGSDDSTSRFSSSTTSTTSSLLSQFFPQRYFILKSLSQFDLDLSKEEGLWATQKHNEEILNQAFRTSKDVYLIFSVNKSGEFYGYAK
ncbi:hypothetical protein C0992_003611 [Termitomyces sp. T32_za158]|nr:hypothetical protein C0992_003611 [Termitomyces sp. T32_za158]